MTDTKESKAKNKMLAVKMSADILRDFLIAANLRGSTMSALVYQFVLKTIREEKERSPHVFPDFANTPSPASRAENEIDEILLEAFDGKPFTPEQVRRYMSIAKKTLEIKELRNGETEG